MIAPAQPALAGFAADRFTAAPLALSRAYAPGIRADATTDHMPRCQRRWMRPIPTHPRPTLLIPLTNPSSHIPK